MSDIVTYFNSETNDTVEIKEGFNVWVFLFGAFVPLFKGQIGFAIIFFFGIVLVYLIGSIIPFVGPFILRNVTYFAIARNYHKFHADYLLSSGYEEIARRPA